MSDSNYSFHFPLSSYPPSSEYPDNEPDYAWVAPAFPRPSFPAQGPSDAPPSLPKAPANSSAVVAQDRSLNNKVPIPRSTNSTAVPNRGRVSRACENCRDQKVKCSGQRPTCQRCQEAGIQCSYGDRKREKMARRLSDLTARVQAFETLLQNIYPNLDSQSAQYVEQVLNEQLPNNDPSSSRQLMELPSPLLPADPGSPLGSVDFTNEDFNRDEKIQAMGYFGEHSEIAWIFRLKNTLNHFGHNPLGKDADRSSVATVNFFLDDTDGYVIEDVDLFQRPLPTVADQLVDSYFQVVHPSFPIMGKVTFLGQYKSFYSGPSVRPGKRWLAILNLIFAIATKYTHDVSQGTEINSDDHLIYFSRAWKLSMRDVSLLDHPNLQQVQVEGLSAFYLMTVGQANRSWRLSGLSIQSAITMGLSLRNESSRISYNSREIRYRVWWSLYVLHILLCVMTGRLPSSSEDSFTTPLPVPFTEEEFSRSEVEQLIEDHESRAKLIEKLSSLFSTQSVDDATTTDALRHEPPSSGKHSNQVASVAAKVLTPNTSLHFLYLVELGLIMRRSIDALYAPGAARKSWRCIEMIVSCLNGHMDTWLSKLPLEFHFVQGTQACERERLSLAFSFYSAKILITQPCLSRLVRQTSWNSQTETVCATMAAMCVDLASQMLDLLPDTPDLSWVYHVAPWWCIVHYIMQATTVLLISLYVKLNRDTTQYTRVVERVSKAIDWLAKLGSKDLSARRAWTVCQDLFSRHEVGVALSSNSSG